MTRLLLFTLLSVFSIFAHCKEYNDGYFVVYLMESDAKDVKYETGITEERIKTLMSKGRHVISVVPTKFGLVAVHEKAKKKMEQKYVHLENYYLKKRAKKLFKEGYIIEYYNEKNNGAIITKNPAITKQKYLGQAGKRKIARQNKKGIYVKLGCGTEYIGQNDMNGISSQERVFHYSLNNFISGFKEMAAKGYIIGSVETSYNKYGNNTYFTVLYDKPKKPYKGKQYIGIFETKKELTNFIKKYATSKCTIKGIWGGWEKRDYAAEEARYKSAKSESGTDILLGLGSSLLQLNSAIKSPSSSTSSSISSVSSAVSSTKSKAKASTGKCKYCGGSGNCTATTAAGRKNACSGSGLCGHCSGTGWIKAGGSEAKCTACNGTKKCKSCGGTGKCKHCKK